MRQLIKFKFQISSSRVGPRRQNERRAAIVGAIRMKCFEIFFFFYIDYSARCVIREETINVRVLRTDAKRTAEYDRVGDHARL